MESKYWKQFKGKEVRVIINDFSKFPVWKDGIFLDSDETHIFLEINNIIKPILKTIVMRVDLK